MLLKYEKKREKTKAATNKFITIILCISAVKHITRKYCCHLIL